MEPKGWKGRGEVGHLGLPRHLHLQTRWQNPCLWPWLRVTFSHIFSQVCDRDFSNWCNFEPWISPYIPSRPCYNFSSKLCIWPTPHEKRWWRLAQTPSSLPLHFKFKFCSQFGWVHQHGWVQWIWWSSESNRFCEKVPPALRHPKTLAFLNLQKFIGENKFTSVNILMYIVLLRHIENPSEFCWYHFYWNQCIKTNTLNELDFCHYVWEINGDYFIKTIFSNH